MNRKLASNSLKVLLFAFLLLTIFVGVYILPTNANEFVSVYPDFASAKKTILVMLNILIVLLLLAISIIMYLLKLFDRSETFTLKFTKGLKVLFWIGIISTIGIVVLSQYLSSIGILGPLLFIGITVTIFVIMIVATVIMLVRSIVIESITYKNEYDLTV